VLGLWLATAVTPEGGGGDLVAIIVAALGALGVIATAFGPALTERVKRPSSKQESAPTTTPATVSNPAPAHAVGAATGDSTARAPTLTTANRDDVFDALEESIRDLRAQRDAAQAELSRLRNDSQRRIDELSRELYEARIAIARLQAGRYS
jgi:hypothetical protein